MRVETDPTSSDAASEQKGSPDPTGTLNISFENPSNIADLSGDPDAVVPVCRITKKDQFEKIAHYLTGNPYAKGFTCYFDAVPLRDAGTLPTKPIAIAFVLQEESGITPPDVIIKHEAVHAIDLNKIQREKTAQKHPDASLLSEIYAILGEDLTTESISKNTDFLPYVNRILLKSLHIFRERGIYKG